jgi:uncharacterized protein YoxC
MTNWGELQAMASVIATIVLIVALGFVIYATAHIRRMVDSLTHFLNTTENRLNPLIEETERTLKSIRIITDDLGSVTAGVKEVSGAVTEVAANVRAMNAAIETVKEQASIRAHGIKAGVQAALGMLLNHKSDRR